MLAKYAKPPGCAGCDLAQLGTGFSPPSGPPQSPLLFVGEALGFNEAMAGEPFCLEARTPILMADLTWRPLNDVHIGDEIIAVDEEPRHTGKGVTGCNGRRFKIATVLKRHDHIAECQAVETETGTLVATPDHRVLAYDGAHKWLRVDQLQGNANGSGRNERSSRLSFIGRWKKNDSYIAGWLSGFFDGEGHVIGSQSLHRPGRRKYGNVGWTQNVGSTYDRAVRYLAALAVPVAAYEDVRTNGVVCRRGRIGGNVFQRLRFLGMVRPERLVQNFIAVLRHFSLPLSGIEHPRVLSRMRVGRRRVIDIQTTAGTFIADGFIVHNCGAAGGLFNARMLPMAGLHRDNVRVHNCINCRPPNDWLVGAPWQFAALAHCRQYLQESLDAPALQVVVTLGDTALRQVLHLWGTDGVRVQDFHGTIHRDPSDRFWVVPTYHPSHLQRGAINLLDVVRFDIDRARGIIQRGVQRRPVSLMCDPPVEWFRAWAAGVIARASADPAAVWLAVDIETPDKEGGRDEGELTTEDRSTQIDRVNLSTDPDEGITIPYAGPYIGILDDLLKAENTKLFWNCNYDLPRLKMAGHQIGGQAWDLMWAAHHYQSDWPLGLGFWAPFASDFGAWKHLAKSPNAEDRVRYAAVDGFQTRRLGDYLIQRLMQLGLWEAFYRHTHLREQYVLRPAHEGGCPISEERLDRFHEKLQLAATERLGLIQQSEMAETLRPKAGYAKKPKGDPPIPPKSIVGDAGKKGDTAKQQYMEGGIALVAREVSVEILYCAGCGVDGVGPKHKCKAPVASGRRDRTPAADPTGEPAGVEDGSHSGPVADLQKKVVRQVRWFWQLPFNPDSSQQILAFIKASGLEPGRAKKTRKETADKETLKKLYVKTGNKIYQYLLEYKAVKKVDSTYAVGAKRRIWSDGRLHPQATFRPSTLRDSYVNPSIQNVVADKDTKGVGSLAAGFRDCIVADPGYRLVELDYSSIEAKITGWLGGDRNYMRLASLGVHAYLTAHLLHAEKQLAEVPSLSWSDGDLAAIFSEIKKKFPVMYDRAKRTVHGVNYGLTTYGMANNFPEVFPSLKIAEKVQEMYFSLCPQLPEYQSRMRDYAYENHHIGGSYVDDYTQLVSGGHHPFGYIHWFYGVMSFRPLTEANYRRLTWIAKNRMNRLRHPRVAIIHNRPFEKVMGEDSKRVVAFSPQSIAAGILKEAQLMLFHPDSPDYIGMLADGKTPLIAPIHDSLLLHVPDHLADWVIMHCAEVMRRPIPTMPMLAEWGMGTHLRVNVAAKVSPVGGSWAECDDVKLPDMAPATARETLYTPVDEAEWEDVEDLQVMIAAEGGERVA